MLMYDTPDDDIYDAYFDDEGEPLYDEDEYMNEQFWTAVDQDDAEAVEYMVGDDININYRGENGCTPLHIAAWNGNLDIVRMLLDAGAKVNLRDDDGMTPLRRVSGEHASDIIALLKEHGAR